MGDVEESPKKRWQPFKRFDGRIEGWRGFAMETAVIGIGVLLALGAEQLVEQWTWETKVERAEESLRLEQGGIFGFMAEYTVVAPCILAQLDRIEAHLLLDDPEPMIGATNQPIPLLLRMPYRPMGEDAWTAENASGVVTHMDYERQQATGSIYALLRPYLVRQDDLFEAASRLTVLTKPVPLSETSRAQLLQSVAEQRALHALQQVVAGQIMASIDGLGRAPDPEFTNQLYQQQSGTVAYCQEQDLPLGDWRAAVEAFSGNAE